MKTFILESQNTVSKCHRPIQVLAVLLSVMSLYFVAYTNKNPISRLGYDLD